MNNTQETILDYLKSTSIDFIENHNDKCDTNSISEYLYLSRSSTSQYLNNLASQGHLIKIKERPVIFLNRNEIETKYDISIVETVFDDKKCFFDYFNSLTSKLKNFAKAVGHDTSLKYCIIQCQAAIKYPPHGLPVILSGEPGTGKKMLGRLMYEYSLDEKILSKADTFYIYNCKSEVDHAKELFGLYDEDRTLVECGILNKMKSGILFFNHAEYLDNKTKEQLKYLIRHEKNTNFNEKDISPEIRLVFSTELKSNEFGKDDLFQKIPVVINVPSLDERFPEDRKGMIYHFVKNEAKRINDKILLSNSLLKTLLTSHLDRNIEELKYLIRVCCANALQSQQKNDDTLVLYQYHLPSNLLSRQSFESDFSEDNNLVPIESLNVESEIDKILFYFDKLLGIYDKYGLLNTDDFYQQATDLMNDYFDFLVFNKKYFNNRINSIEKVLENIFDNLGSRYNFLIPANGSYVIARIIYMQIYYSGQYYEWSHNNPDVSKITNKISVDLENEYGIIKELSSMIRHTLDIDIDEVNSIFLSLYFRFFTNKTRKRFITGIIISHGYSTASSIADASNRLLGKRIFESLDMPLDTSVKDIVNKLYKYFENNYISNEVILLVDMGSLENIGELLKDIPNTNIGIINNISTKIALDIGVKIMQEIPMEEILSSTCRETLLHYKIISKQKKEIAIIFTTETGMNSTDRIIQLFKDSMPKKNKINIIPYDYYELQKNLTHDKVFSKFDVLFITGTLKIEVPGIHFIPLEDMINLNNVDMVSSLLSNIYTKQEMDRFIKNLTRNFSMYNVLNYITILNPDTLLNFVEKAINRLEKKMGILFSNKVKVGMYIHISCLVERLVTKNAITNFDNIDDFIAEHKDFIELVKDSFADISHHYNIEIPASEIAYIYIYIKTNNEGE